VETEVFLSMMCHVIATIRDAKMLLFWSMLKKLKDTKTES